MTESPHAETIRMALRTAASGVHPPDHEFRFGPAHDLVEVEPQRVRVRVTALAVAALTVTMAVVLFAQTRPRVNTFANASPTSLGRDAVWPHEAANYDKPEDVLTAFARDVLGISRPVFQREYDSGPTYATLELANGRSLGLLIVPLEHGRWGIAQLGEGGFIWGPNELKAPLPAGTHEVQALVRLGNNTISKQAKVDASRDAVTLPLDREPSAALFIMRDEERRVVAAVGGMFLLPGPTMRVGP